MGRVIKAEDVEDVVVKNTRLGELRLYYSNLDYMSYDGKSIKIFTINGSLIEIKGEITIVESEYFDFTKGVVENEDSRSQG